MFKPGDTVIFSLKNINTDFWMNLTNSEKIKYYGDFFHLEYDFSKYDLSCCQPLLNPHNTIPIENCKPKLFTYVCEHSPQFGHCVLMDINNGELLPMCHTNNFRLVSDDEC